MGVKILICMKNAEPILKKWFKLFSLLWFTLMEGHTVVYPIFYLPTWLGKCATLCNVLQNWGIASRGINHSRIPCSLPQPNKHFTFLLWARTMLAVAANEQLACLSVKTVFQHVLDPGELLRWGKKMTGCERYHESVEEGQWRRASNFWTTLSAKLTFLGMAKVVWSSQHHVYYTSL